MPLLRIGKVIGLHFGGPSARFPFLSPLGKVAQILFLLRVYRDHREFFLLPPLDLAVNEETLGVPLRMIRPFLRFAVRLQAIAQGLQQPVHRALTDRMALVG